MSSFDSMMDDPESKSELYLTRKEVVMIMHGLKRLQRWAKMKKSPTEMRRTRLTATRSGAYAVESAIGVVSH